MFTPEVRQTPHPAVLNVPDIACHHAGGAVDGFHVAHQAGHIAPVVVHMWITKYGEADRPFLADLYRDEFAFFLCLFLAVELLAAQAQQLIDRNVGISREFYRLKNVLLHLCAIGLPHRAPFF